MSGAHHHNNVDLSAQRLSPEVGRRLTMTGLGLGAVGLGATLIGMLSEGTRVQALHSYLVAYFFIATLGVGALFFALLQHLVGAVWSVVIRRVAEALSAPLAALAVLFLPIAIGMKDLFPWLGHAAHEPAVAAKSGYLNTPFFLIRAAVYLLTWGGLAYYSWRRAMKLDQTGDPFILLGMRKLAAPAMFLFGLTLTFAGFDWLMSLDPEWYSTMFGVYIFAGTVVSSFSLITLVALWLRRQGLLADVITVEHYHDMGKLIFGFIVFWTYITFSQYFLIWYSNIPEETAWFAHRWHGSWATVAVVLIFGHFAIPFFALLSRNAKRSLKILGIVTPWLIFFHYVDLHFIVMPQIHHEGISPSWLDLTALLGVGGVFVGLVAQRITAAPVVPIRDPRLPASMEFENA